MPSHHRGQDALQDRAQDVEDIADQPDDDELDREPIGITLAELLYDLRREDDDCGAGIRSAYAGEGSERMAEQQTPAGYRDRSVHTAAKPVSQDGPPSRYGYSPGLERRVKSTEE